MQDCFASLDRGRGSRHGISTRLKKAMPALINLLRDARAADRTTTPASSSGKQRFSDAFNSSNSKSNSTGPLLACQEFNQVAAVRARTIFTDHESIPSLEIAFSQFQRMYPRYVETTAIDTLRATEYAHLDEDEHVCLDYCGFGLFSHLQQLQHWDSASFVLADISVNLRSHALYGAAEPGTVECDIQKRIMDYFNIQGSDYMMVFTSSKSASFKLLAEAYPFETCRHLVTVYDYGTESVGWMLKRAKEKGAKIYNANFKWSSLRIVSSELRKRLAAKRRKRPAAKGLFVFPVQSRVSGTKYSYRWLCLAQQNNWHVLLDASALGPKDMGSLALSLFRPHFIITSFYKMFGADPSGFGCLFIKNSVIDLIQDGYGAASTGIVRIIPYPSEWHAGLSSSSHSEELAEFVGTEGGDHHVPGVASHQNCSVEPSFSGPVLGFTTQFDSEKPKLPKTEGVVEDDNDESESSVGGSGREGIPTPVFSPTHVFSEDGTDNLFCIDIGRTPLSCISMSEDLFSAPLSSSPFSDCLSGGMNVNVCSESQKEKRQGLEDTNFFSEMQNSMQNANDDTPEDHNCVLSVHDDENLDARSLHYSFGMEKEDMVVLRYKESPSLGGKSHSSVELQEIEPDLDNGDAGNPNYVASMKAQKMSFDGVQASVLQGLQVNEAVEAWDPKGKAKLTVDWSRWQRAIRRGPDGDWGLVDGKKGLTGRSLSHIWRGIVDYSPTLDLDDERAAGANSEGDNDEEDRWDRQEPTVICRSLDHVEMLGLNKITVRLRYLVNWLISSLLQLRHPGREIRLHLVHIYGPQIKYDRGASVAFNLYDCHGELVQPEVVQMLADKSNISLSIGCLWNLHGQGGYNELQQNAAPKKGRIPKRMEVVTAALNMLTNFGDVYRLWAFVARFLDADFVSRESWWQPAMKDSLP